MEAQLYELTKEALIKRYEELQLEREDCSARVLEVGIAAERLRRDLFAAQEEVRNLEIEIKLMSALSDPPRRRWQDVAASIVEMERCMHHNASLLFMRIDAESEQEDQNFDDALPLYVRGWIEWAQGEILDKFGVEVELYQYGRGGATISVDGFYNEHCRYGASDNNIRYFEHDDLDDEELVTAYAEDCTTLSVLEWVDSEVRKAVRNLPEWWKEEREYWGEDNDSAPDTLPVVDEDVLDALEIMAL